MARDHSAEKKEPDSHPHRLCYSQHKVAKLLFGPFHTQAHQI